MSKFSDVATLYRDLGQGTAFYTKLSEVLVNLGNKANDFVTARKM